MKTKTLHTIANAIGVQDYTLAVELIDSALCHEPGAHWQRDLAKLRAFIQDDARRPVFTVIRKESGEGKLGKDFLSFSVLPGVTCPGAGDCLSFCYSYKAWRYPAAFARQAQNTMLMQTVNGRSAITAAVSTLAIKAAGETTDFRLYVDGDFSSGADVAFWMYTLGSNQWLNCYGYSKSFHELLGYDIAHTWPANYTLNMSEGHKHKPSIVQAILALPISRGRFGAVKTTGKYKPADWRTTTYRKDILAVHKATTGRKAFVCPGRCGSCVTRNGVNSHACGDQAFNNVDIIIAVH